MRSASIRLICAGDASSAIINPHCQIWSLWAAINRICRRWEEGVVVSGADRRPTASNRA
jgi:hypothetical protein